MCCGLPRATANVKQKELAACLRSHLEERGIILIKKDADDSDRFNVLQEELLSGALSMASQAKEQDGALLVQCWGGCNRAPSLAVALLMLQEGMDVVQAAARVMAHRGAILTNRSFRRRLVTLAYHENRLPACLERMDEPQAMPSVYRWDTASVEELLVLAYLATRAKYFGSFYDGNMRPLHAYIRDAYMSRQWGEVQRLQQRRQLLSSLLAWPDGR